MNVSKTACQGLTTPSRDIKETSSDDAFYGIRATDHRQNNDVFAYFYVLSCIAGCVCMKVLVDVSACVTLQHIE